MRNWVRVSLVLVSAFSLAACGIKESADEMKDTSNEIKEHSKKLSDRTRDLERELTKKESNAVMQQELNKLFGRAGFSMPDVNDDGFLFTTAGTAIHAMLFQYWKGDYEEEDLRLLDLRAREASNAFFGLITSQVSRNFSVDVMNPSVQYKALAALGAMLDEMDITYRARLMEAKLPRLSFYDMIVVALKNRSVATRKEILPETSAMILLREHEAMTLLQLRHNILPVMVLASITDLQDRTGLAKVWMGLKMLVSKPGAPILNSTRVDIGQLPELNILLEKTLQTRADLRRLGIEPEYNTTFLQLLEGVDFGQKAILSGGESSAGSLRVKAGSRDAAALRKFARLYTEVVGDARTTLDVRKQKEVELRLKQAESYLPEESSWSSVPEFSELSN